MQEKCKKFTRKVIGLWWKKAYDFLVWKRHRAVYMKISTFESITYIAIKLIKLYFMSEQDFEGLIWIEGINRVWKWERECKKGPEVHM